MKKINRREFLKESSLGGSLLAGGAVVNPRLQPGGRPANEHGLFAWWRLGDGVDDAVVDRVTGIEDPILGNYRYTDGVDVTDKALKLDGFTTCVTRRADEAPRFSKAFTIEAWVALAAYPWNWCPVVSQQKEERAGYYFGIGPRGKLALQLSLSGIYYRGMWRACTSKSPIPLKEWTHIVGTFSGEEGITLYLNGQETGKAPLEGTFVPAPDVDLRIGMNHEKREPSHPHREHSNLPTWFSLDGILDEIKIHDRAFTPQEAMQAFSSRVPASPPDLPARIMPSGPPGPGRFGAYYTNLRYYEEWDNLWRIGDHPDVVVQFDGSPLRVVFWRGTSYSPAWVMEDGTWISDQSVEAWTEGETYEHMNDPRCTYSHVRIIENHAARVVVHWRYALANTRGDLWRVDEKTGMACWADEYYSFYPDGVGVRYITWKKGSLGKTRQFQETTPLCHAGQRPEDIIHLDALTLMNMEGEQLTYSWPGTSESRKSLLPPSSNIQIVNLKSNGKPFLIFEPGSRIQVLGGGIRKGIYSAFPLCNHWPVAMIPSDGRTCQAPDQPSSFSPAICEPVVHESEGTRSYTCWLCGTVPDGKQDELVNLARSWVEPPELIAVENAASEGYDKAERAWKVRVRDAGKVTSLKLVGSEATPIIHAAIVVKNWGMNHARIRMNGKRLEPSEYRIGRQHRLDGSDLVVWIAKKSKNTLEIQLEPD